MDIRGENLNLEKFNLTNVIGEGNFSKVFKCQHISSRYIYAMKIIVKAKLEGVLENYIDREIKIHRVINHINIVSLYNHFQDHEHYYLIMEYCSFGSVYHLIKKIEAIPDNIASTFVYQLANALIFLQSLNIVHRDIKSENVLIGNSGEIKLTDFGCCSRFYEDKKTSVLGSPLYYAPELINEVPYDISIDIWCVGVFIYEMLTTRTPFDAGDWNVTRRNISLARYTMPSNLNVTAQKLISQCLSLNPALRPSPFDVQMSEYVTKFGDHNVCSCQDVIPIVTNLRKQRHEKEMKWNLNIDDNDNDNDKDNDKK